MTSDISYTTEEVAKLLKISKLTVYDLIKKGELVSYRVGKQMRIDAADLEAYKTRSKSSQAPAQPPFVTRETVPSSDSPKMNTGTASQTLVITGQDMSLDILSKHMEKKITGYRPLREHVGSLDSLIAMYRGESDIVSTHLFDGDTGEYNISYIRKILVSSPVVVVRLLARQAGFFVPKGNPKKLLQWEDLKQPGLRLANREKGSGARVLLDEQLRLHRIPNSTLSGYEREETSHLGVAGQVAAGHADVAVGIEKAAALVGGIDFVPLIQERYDLVMLKKPENLGWIQSVIRILESEPFQQELRSIHGYDLSSTGHIIYES